MSIGNRAVKVAATVVPVLALGACSFGGPKSGAELSTEDACRAQANQAYDEQHRALLSEGGDQATTPFSGNGNIVQPSAGLSDRYAHEVAVDDCIGRRTSSTQGGATVGPGSH